MINRRLFLGGSLSVAALATLTACGSRAGSGGGSSSGTAVELAKSDLNPQDRSKLKQGGEFRTPITGWIPNFNGMHVDGNLVDNNTRLRYFVGCFNWIYKDDGSFEPRKDFLLEYKEEEKDGKTVITMKLNPKAKWNSGQPIQVADYQGVWKACNGANEAFRAASTDGWRNIESIEQGADKFEMIVTFDSIYPDWSSVLSADGLIPATLTTSPEAFNSWTDGKVTDHWTGPFIVTECDATKKTIVAEPNPNWWGEKPLLDKVSFKAIESNQLGTAFGNKEIDLVDYIIDATTYQQCQKRADAQIRQSSGLQWRHFTINGSSGPLADQKLRQALLKGIDRITITKADLQGLPVPAEQLQLGNHLFMPSDTNYQDNTGDLAFNKEQAAKELDELGWKLPEGGEVREKDGKKLSIKYLRLPDTPTSVTEGKILQANMKEIGVEIVMDDTNTDDFFPERIAKGKFEIVAFTWQGTPYPMHNIGQIYGKGSDSNYTGVHSDKLEELIKQVAVEGDKDKRVTLANEADKEIWSLATVVPIYARAEYTAVPKNLANFGSFGLSKGRAEDVGYLAE